ncbi:nucleotidyltransferase domain-containing protein [Kyrpidia sp.]|uniref:nucleotidyltransferase domain-containing protein n=1 Tax=Kyrpidia sp. TaxID=2073077 RepID=UPI00338F0BAF|nr:nucleotidyltransferase domain-containing protein [Kyrpidia sp.]
MGTYTDKSGNGAALGYRIAVQLQESVLGYNRKGSSGCSSGGSRATGEHGPDSEFDFAIYYRGRTSTHTRIVDESLARLAARGEWVLNEIACSGRDTPTPRSVRISQGKRC